jgi:hypothetical protein
MADFDLLDNVLAPDGWFAVVGIKGKAVQQTLVQTRAEVDELAATLLADNQNVYFGCAKYETDANRKQENAKYFKAFWMDIDCGPEKAAPNPRKGGKIEGYIDQATGMQELQRFCKTIGLPKPTIINSGRGWHLYWILDEVITREQWQPVSNRLLALCNIHNLIVDSSVFEAARILRIPGTLNFKDSPPSKVEAVSLGKTVTLAQMREILAVPDEPEKKFAPRRDVQRSALTLSLMGNRIAKFKTIMLKSAKGEGCQQLVHCYQNQDTISYDLWRSALSITAFCEEGASAAHKMSEQYPGYDPEEVEIKVYDLQRTGGPHFCSTFEKWNPGGCDGCQHKGKITTPIVLGKEIARDEPTEEGYLVDVEPDEDEDEEPVQLTIPPYPFPFYRGKAGGIYRQAKDDDSEDELVYENDVYVVKRMRDPEHGEVALMRLHLPRDGVMEFTAPLNQIIVKEDLRKILAKQGVAGYPKQMEMLSQCILGSVKELQITKKAELMRTQFGWVDNDSKFIVGDREITADAIYYSPPSSHTATIAQYMAPKGTLEQWKEVYNLYARPGLEANAFAALTGFGSPLLKFTGLNGAIINVIFKNSGSGKSTTLFMCNSIWGHPERLMAIPRDTMNARMHRLGVMNNLPFTMDEITNMKPEEFSDLSYAMSQGRGKDRQKASANELRLNMTSWNSLSLASANASFYEKLGALKNSPDGERMRVIEYEIGYSDVITTEEGKHMFDHVLRDNYGHAGDIYAQYLVANREEVIRSLLEVQAKIDKELRLTQRERFWSAGVACNITGGLIAKRLGLIDYDMKAVYKWACNMIREVRNDNEAPMDDASNTIGDYINRHLRNVLVINGEADQRTQLTPAPLQEPYGELIIRFEPDTKRMYIAAKHFRDDCVKRQVNAKDTLKQLQARSIYLGSTTRRMTTGTKIKGTPVHVMMFDCSTPEFISMDDYIKAGADDADRGSGVPD